MTDDVHLVVYFLILVGTIDKPLIGILEHLINIAQTVHLFLHLHQQLLLRIAEFL